MMLTCVTYLQTPGAHFDRAYYVSHHLPLVREAWGPFGLESIDAFFPAGDGAGMEAIAICRFRDTAALKAALAAPGTAEVMADVKQFTNISPSGPNLMPV